jgi:hypothetical protein
VKVAHCFPVLWVGVICFCGVGCFVILFIIYLFRITGFLDFFHRPVFQKLGNTFRKVDLFPSSGEWWETPALLGPLERANLNH